MSTNIITNTDREMGSRLVCSNFGYFGETDENPFKMDNFLQVTDAFIQAGRVYARDFGDNSEELLTYAAGVRHDFMNVDLVGNNDYLRTLYTDLMRRHNMYDGWAAAGADKSHEAAGLLGVPDVWLELMRDYGEDDFDKEQHVERFVRRAAILMDLAAYAPRVYCMVHNGVVEFEWSKFVHSFAEFRQSIRYRAAMYLDRMDRKLNRKWSSLGCGFLNYDMPRMVDNCWQHELYFVSHETTESYYLQKLVDVADLNYARITQGASPF